MSVLLSKVCTKCSEDKPLSEYGKSKRDGLSCWCKSCCCAYARAYRATHKEEIRASQRTYRTVHKEKKRLSQRAYYASHGEERRAYSCAYRDANREKVHADDRAYKTAHREEARTYSRAYYAVHGEEARAYSRAYSAAHREELNARRKQYRATGAGKVSDARSHAKRRMRITNTGAAVALTAEEWRARITEYGSCCCWCGKELAENEVVMDHIVALANGGTHIASNVAPSCYDCNATKFTRDWGYPYPGVPRDEEPEIDSMWL